MNKATVIVSAVIGLGFIVMSLFIDVDVAVERSLVLLYSIPCLLFGILICLVEMAFVGG